MSQQIVDGLVAQIENLNSEELNYLLEQIQLRYIKKRQAQQSEVDPVEEIRAFRRKVQAEFGGFDSIRDLSPEEVDDLIANA